MATPVPICLDNILYQAQAIHVNEVFGDNSLKRVCMVKNKMGKALKIVKQSGVNFKDSADGWKKVDEHVTAVQDALC